MAKKCPTGFVCTDRSTIWLVILIAAVLIGGAWWFSDKMGRHTGPEAPKVYVVHAPPAVTTQAVRPDLFPEPIRRFDAGIPSLASRGPVGPIQQVGILTAEGGSATSASPDRTIIPLFGRELDPRRSKWNYYTRTDGVNPVQVPVRVKNRLCDDDTNGCDEIYSDDSVHVPVLGRSFKATVYKKSFFL
jgi:hypothetical protein